MEFNKRSKRTNVDAQNEMSQGQTPLFIIVYKKISNTYYQTNRSLLVPETKFEITSYNNQLKEY